MPDLIKQIEEKSHDFDFFQAVTLLEEYFQKKGTDADPLKSGRIQFSSDTSTAFPPCDIASVKTDENGVMHFFLSFMGLLGVSSPLPHYFTEYGTQHEVEESTLADFLSIFNHRMYVLFYQAWKKYRLVNRSAKHDTFQLFQKIPLLAGLNSEKLEERKKMVAYIGILAGICRSAEGLRTIVSNFFNDIPVSVQQWIPRWAPVHDLKQIGLDSVLGSSSMLGTHIQDTGGKFRIILGPLEKETFETFLPEKPNVTLLKKIITDYSADPLEFDIEVKLKPAALTPVVLGAEDAQLGITASCGPSLEKSDDYSIVIGS